MTEFYGDKNLLIRSLKLTKVAPFFVRACFKILNAAHFSRHVLSQSPLVRAVGQQWPTHGACAKLFALDDFKWRIFMIVIKYDSKHPRYYYRFFISYKSLASCPLAS